MDVTRRAFIAALAVIVAERRAVAMEKPAPLSPILTPEAAKQLADIRASDLSYLDVPDGPVMTLFEVEGEIFASTRNSTYQILERKLAARGKGPRWRLRAAKGK